MFLQTIAKQQSICFQRRFFTSRLSQLSGADTQHFERMLGNKSVITDPDELAPLNKDYMRKYTGRSQLALRP